MRALARSALAATCIAATCAVALAQTPPAHEARAADPQHERPPHPHRGPRAWGGLGYATLGIQSGSWSALEGTLADDALLGRGYGPASAGVTYGGGGGALLGSRVWLGGGGYGIAVATADSPRGEAKLSGGGGGFDVGYAALNRDDWLVIPFVGAGGFGYTLSLSNLTGETFELFEGAELAPGKKADFDAGFWTCDVGVRVFSLLFSGRGGFAVGASVGYTAAFARDPWKGPSGKNVGQETASLSTAYVRLSLGGGGFSTAE